MELARLGVGYWDTGRWGHSGTPRFSFPCSTAKPPIARATLVKKTLFCPSTTGFTALLTHSLHRLFFINLRQNHSLATHSIYLSIAILLKLSSPSTSSSSTSFPLLIHLLPTYLLPLLISLTSDHTTSNATHLPLISYTTFKRCKLATTAAGTTGSSTATTTTPNNFPPRPQSFILFNFNKRIIPPNRFFKHKHNHLSYTFTQISLQ